MVTRRGAAAIIGRTAEGDAAEGGGGRSSERRPNSEHCGVERERSHERTVETRQKKKAEGSLTERKERLQIIESNNSSFLQTSWLAWYLGVMKAQHG